MTALVASEPPVLPDDDGPRPGAAALAVALHVLAAVLIVLASRLMPPRTPTAAPAEQAVEVLFVPAAVQFDALNLDESAEIGPETTIVGPSGDPEPAPSGDPASVPRVAAAEPVRAAETLPTADPQPQPQAQAQPRPQPQQAPPPPPAPAPPQPTLAAPQPAPEPSPVLPSVSAPAPERTPPPPAPQVAAVPPPRPHQPPQRPAPRQAEPAAPAAPRQRGELNEVDLFGRSRLPQQPAARAPARAPTGGRNMTIEGVFLLRQVLRVWPVNWRDPSFREIGFSFRMVLQADGTLAHPWGRNDPWQPRMLIDNYDELLQPGQEQVRRLAESFAYALKMGQPYNLPPTPGPYPRPVALTFRMGDL